MFNINQTIRQLFLADNLSWVMAILISLVILTISAFSNRYMAGDRYYRRHAGDIFLLGIAVLVMVFADHLLVLLAGWAISNFMLVRLMVHKKEWRAARNAGRLALANFTIGFIMLSGAAWVMANAAGTASIHVILAEAHSLNALSITVALSLLTLAALTQSAAWPFHKWLTSSLNSPTPVSALMHAGLVNGGGFLLVRFAPLFLTQPIQLKVLFMAGLVTAVIGTFWKLLQTDVKRILACSTMAQMGFMIAQCGMGLFAPAVSHLVWHGLFKAYLFLGSGSVMQEKRRKNPFVAITPVSLALATVFGAIGAIVFAQVTRIPLALNNTGSLMIGLAFMTATQLACTVLETISMPKLIAALIASVAVGGLYGSSIRVIEMILAPLNLWQPQALDEIYISGSLALFLIWLAMNMNAAFRLQNSPIWKHLYVAGLGGSQPHPATITATRASYQF